MSPIEIMIRDAADVAASLDLISRPPKKARPRRATTAGLHLAGSGRGSNLNSMEKHYDER